MSRIERNMLGLAATVILSACSGTNRTPPEPVATQTQGSANVPLIPSRLSDSETTAPVLPAAGGSASTFAGAGVQRATAAQSPLRDPNEVAVLRGMALRAASVAGVSSPRTMHAVAASDHQAAQTILSGAIVNDHAPVYVIKMTGGPFTATHHRAGVSAPQGNVLTVTVDAATHRVTDVGYVNEEPDLSQIDPLIVDLSVP